MRKGALIAGVSETDFWDMTVGEAVRACDAFMERRRDSAYFAYTNAMTVGLFVGSMFSPRQPPKLHDIFPDLFEEDEEREEEARTDASVANFMKFADYFNQRVQNGNGKSESENNG